LMDVPLYSCVHTHHMGCQTVCAARLNACCPCHDEQKHGQLDRL
jgi:hypothetical protein